MYQNPETGWLTEKSEKDHQMITCFLDLFSLPQFGTPLCTLCSNSISFQSFTEQPLYRPLTMECVPPKQPDRTSATRHKKLGILGCMTWHSINMDWFHCTIPSRKRRKLFKVMGSTKNSAMRLMTPENQPGNLMIAMNFP